MWARGRTGSRLHAGAAAAQRAVTELSELTLQGTKAPALHCRRSTDAHAARQAIPRF